MTEYKTFFVKWFEVHAVDHCNQSCVFCNHHSPFFKKKEHRADEYFPWIDEMIRRNIVFLDIGIIGGEPFLHSDLTSFVRSLKERYQKNIALTTNCFWMTDQAIEEYRPLLEMVHLLCFSIYPNIAHKKGEGEIERMVERIGKEYPRMTCEVRKIEPNKSGFCKWQFKEEPEEVTAFCDFQGDCTNLLPDGRLARCGVGGYAESNPTVTKQFLEADQSHLFYDLKRDDGADFGQWYNRWPLDPCRYCSMWKGNWGKWNNDPNIRKDGGMLKYLPVIE